MTAYAKVVSPGVGPCELGVFLRTDSTHRLDAYGLVFNYIATGTANDTSIIDYANNLKSYDTTCAVGTLCGPPFSTYSINFGPGANAATKPASTAGVMFVSKTGNDSNDGLSWGSAKLTGAGAETALPGNGGTINFAAGTYSGAITISKPTTVTCVQTNGTPTVTLTIPNASNVNLFTITGTGSLTITGCYLDGNRANQTTGGYLVYSTAAVSPFFATANVMINAFSGAINFTGGATNTFIRDNLFSNNGPLAPGGYDVQMKAVSTNNLAAVHIEGNIFASASGCISLTSDNGAMTKLFEVYIMHNTCNQSNGVGSFATTGISVVGNTTLGQTTSIYIRGNSFFNYSTLATGQNFIVVTNVSQSQITDNIIPGMGASGDTAGIVLTSSSNNNISRNNISNFNGTGDGAASIKIADVGSTSNAISVNQITTTSTNPIVDNGTTTLYAQWINGDLFAASILTKTLKLQGSSYFFGGTAAGTPPAIGGGAIIGGLFVLG